MTKGRTPPEPTNTPDPVHMTPDQQQRYMHHLHRMQAGVALQQGIDPTDGAPKHLRVGINSAHISHAALVRVLVARGLISNDEYVEALIQQTQEEADSYEERLARHYGAEGKFKLGSHY
jgi:hypothetical protein